MIDLHLHTTASDGRCTPLALVDRVVQAGVSTIAVTDHDTTIGIPHVIDAAAPHGIRVIAGIEITAVDAGIDVHVLGYFIDIEDEALADFLAQQRESRLARIHEIGRRLRDLGMAVDTEVLADETRRTAGRAIGRPQVARAMIDAGYVRDIREAFDLWLSPGRPAFVPRLGASPEDVIAIIHAAGGLASLAHPGRTQIDDRIRALVAAGLDAIEVYHPDHDDEARARYARLAGDLNVLVSGGSDFHGDPAIDREPGAATLPDAEWQRLFESRLRHAGRE